jgi:hypothetical protein
MSATINEQIFISKSSDTALEISLTGQITLEAVQAFISPDSLILFRTGR